MRALLLGAGLLVPSCLFAQSASLRRSGDAPEAVRAWFAGVDAFFDEAGALTRDLSREAPSAKKAGAFHERLAKLAETYGKISGDSAGAKAAQDFSKTGGELYDLSKPSVNRFVELMRQEALKSPGPEGPFPPNALLSTDNGELAFLDVSAAPLVERGLINSPALRAAARVGASGASVIVGRDRLWLRQDGAELFADFSAAAAVRLRWKLPPGDAMDNARMYFLTRALYESGFAVSMESGELTAETGGASSAEQAEDSAAAAWKALEAARWLDGALEAYLAGTINQAENAKRLDELAAAFGAEGELPFARGTDPARVKLGMDAYRAAASRRETLRGRMDKTLRGLGLPGFPSGVAVGQRSIDRHFNSVIEAAEARGEINRNKTGFTRAAVRRRRPGRAEGRALFEAAPVFARITYDRRTAEGGGRVFVTPFLTVKDWKAARHSRGLLTTAGGPQARIAAALAGIPAVELLEARWNDGAGLSVEFPTARGSEMAVLREGQAVRLAGSFVESLPEDRQDLYVRMEEALTAYDRTAGVDALAMWAAGQLRAPGMDASAREEFSETLLSELRRRAGVSPEHVKRVERALAL